MEESQSQVSWSFVQRVLDEILERPSNFVHCYGAGLLMVKFRVDNIGYEIIFDENLEVQKELSAIGENVSMSGEFYKTSAGCSFSLAAPDDWIFLHLFQGKADAAGSTSTGVGSDQC